MSIEQSQGMTRFSRSAAAIAECRDGEKLNGLEKYDAGFTENTQELRQSDFGRALIAAFQSHRLKPISKERDADGGSQGYDHSLFNLGSDPDVIKAASKMLEEAKQGGQKAVEAVFNEIRRIYALYDWVVKTPYFEAMEGPDSAVDIYFTIRAADNNPTSECLDLVQKLMVQLLVAPVDSGDVEQTAQDLAERAHRLLHWRDDVRAASGKV